MQIMIKKEELWNACRELALRGAETNGCTCVIDMRTWEGVARSLFDLICRGQLADTTRASGCSHVTVTAPDNDSMLQFDTNDWAFVETEDGVRSLFKAVPEPGTLEAKLAPGVKRKEITE